MTKDAPEQARLMQDLGYSHYSVHAVKVKGHPFAPLTTPGHAQKIIRKMISLI